MDRDDRNEGNSMVDGRENKHRKELRCEVLGEEWGGEDRSNTRHGGWK